MALLQLGSQEFPLRAGAQRIAGEPSADIALPSGVGSVVVTVADDGRASVVRGDASAEVKINGVLLGVEPSPLLHGDRIEVAGHTLRFADTTQAGSTQLLSADAVAAAVAAARPGAPAKPTTATGGRLVSLVDGREYTVPDTGVVLGRDASADIVIPSTDVSRRHAQIAPATDGYVLTDLSTNGVQINGARVDTTQTLGRGDVIRVGPEEFRFYADVARKTAAPAVEPSAPPAPPPPPPAMPPEPVVVAAAVAAAPVVEAAPPPAPAAPARPVLATLEIINPGPTKGRVFEVTSPLTHIGRGAHNDVVLADGSVSDAHAKLQQRDDGWVLVDVGSTNGTYVGGRKLTAEQRLEGAPDLRFGDVKLAFRSLVTFEGGGSSTRAIGVAAIEEAKKAAAQRKSAVAAPAAPAPSRTPASPAPAAGGSNTTIIIVGVVIVIAVVVGFFLMRG